MSEDQSPSEVRLSGIILREGLSAIEAMIEGKREETLHLEFKSLSSASAANLVKDGRKLLAKSVRGMAKAAGFVKGVSIDCARPPTEAASQRDWVIGLACRPPVFDRNRLSAFVAASLNAHRRACGSLVLSR